MSHRKTTLPVFKMADAVSLGASYTSTPTFIDTIDRVFLVINVTGTPTGTLTVQASIDYLNPGNAGTWFDMPLNLVPLAGASQDYVIDIQQTAIKAIRLKYTRTGSTGTMTATVFGKES